MQHPVIHQLGSADLNPTDEPTSTVDGLPVRSSGFWIREKHSVLNYAGHLFAHGMKHKWPDRIYYELFSGPGKCLMRDTKKEELGSPLVMIEHPFTRFIFTEMNYEIAKALQARLTDHPKASLCEIWCADCAEAIDYINIPSRALTFTFIDPTRMRHAPFSLIEKLKKKQIRTDFLINVPYGTDLKRNVHKYTINTDESAAITQFLGDESWKQLLPVISPKDFCLRVLDLYKDKLASLGYIAHDREVLVHNTNNSLLYLLLFASKHPRGHDFFRKSFEATQHPELSLEL